MIHNFGGVQGCKTIKNTTGRWAQKQFITLN
jgi:hypothetical protein